MTDKQIDDRVTQVHAAPNVYQIRIPLPGSHIDGVNVYVIEDEGESLIYDTGFGDPLSTKTILDALAALDLKVERSSLLLSHFHNDHAGSASSLLPDSRPRYMSAMDLRCAASLRNEDDPALRAMLKEGGVPDSRLDKLVGISTRCVADIPPAKIIVPLHGGERLRVGRYAFEAILTPGHTPGHICLYSRNHQLLFAGDHVLFDISANVCHLPGHTQMLARFVESLERTARLPVRKCFVGHGRCGDGEALRRRVESFLAHHEGRLSDIAFALEGRGEGLTAYEIARLIPWKSRACSFESLSPLQVYFAQVETMSHLQFLHDSGLVDCNVSEGVMRYRLKNGIMSPENGFLRSPIVFGAHMRYDSID